MTKKILASLLAVLLTFGAFMFIVAAADEPKEPEKPAYTPVEYKIEDLVAAVESGKDVYLQPTDIIVLPEQAKPEAPQTQEPAAEGEEGEPGEETPAEAMLVVEYLPGEEASSPNKNSRYVDYKGTGYAIRALGDYTDFAFMDTERRENYAIDFVNDNEYEFEQWKIQSIYSGKEFSRIILVAQWKQPVLKGWQGFKTMMRNYIKTIIDYIMAYLKEWFLELSDFLVGNVT